MIDLKTLRRLAVVLAVAGILGAATIPAATADPPGPGSKQCVPGTNGPSKPGFKPPTSCPGPNH